MKSGALLLLIAISLLKNADAVESPDPAHRPPPVQKECVQFVEVPGSTMSYHVYGLKNVCETCVRAHGNITINFHRRNQTWDLQPGQEYRSGIAKHATATVAVEIASVERCP